MPPHLFFGSNPAAEMENIAVVFHRLDKEDSANLIS